MLQSIDTLFGQVQDYFFATKFQARGSEHDHGLLWIKDAPIYGINNNDGIQSFVDKYITCDKSLLLVNSCESQLHCHKQTCCKKHQLVHRFHFPYPPLHSTQISSPLLNLDKKLQLKAQSIFSTLNEMDKGQDIIWWISKTITNGWTNLHISFEI